MWIRTISESEATGAIGRIYEAARRRAGRVFQIVRTMSLAPRVLEASMGLYREVMFDQHGGLSRADAEMLAVVTSKTNDCFY